MNKLVLIFLSALMPSPSFSFDYFTEPIDYWNENSPKAPDPARKPAKKKESFDWDKYKNPRSKAFYKEGEYTPPEPLMELARNPSDENIRHWFEIVETKNRLMSRLQEKIGEYVAKNKPTIEEASLKNIETQLSSKKLAKDPKRFRFRMYFESSCPHCKRMLQTLSDLSDLGYYVELKQVDRKPLTYRVPFPIIPADRKEIREKKINAWPVLFIADTTKKQLIRINGFHNTESVLAALSKQ